MTAEAEDVLYRYHSENDTLVAEIDRICPPAAPGTDFPRRASDGIEKSALGFPTVDVEVKTESGLIGEIETLIQRGEKFLVSCGNKDIVIMRTQPDGFDSAYRAFQNMLLRHLWLSRRARYHPCQTVKACCAYIGGRLSF